MSPIGLRMLLGLACASAFLWAEGASAAATRQTACLRTHVERLRFSSPARTDTVTVRATGVDCRSTTISLTIRNARGRVIWSEPPVALSVVTSGRFPDEPGVEISPNDVASAVDHWFTVEKTSDAPNWPDGDSGPVASSDDPQQYESPLRPIAYLRVRGAGGRMLCFGVGAESTRCVAIDPVLHRPVIFLDRGL